MFKVWVSLPHKSDEYKSGVTPNRASDNGDIALVKFDGEYDWTSVHASRLVYFKG